MIIILILVSSCVKKEKTSQNIKKTSQELEMTMAYNEGYEKLKINDTYNAAQKFLEAELLFPQSAWAPNQLLWQRILIIFKIITLKPYQI